MTDLMTDYVERCPVCAEPIDYCEGHGVSFGDYSDATVLRLHEFEDHRWCNPAGCSEASEARPLIEWQHANDYATATAYALQQGFWTEAEIGVAVDSGSLVDWLNEQLCLEWIAYRPGDIGGDVVGAEITLTYGGPHERLVLSPGGFRYEFQSGLGGTMVAPWVVAEEQAATILDLLTEIY